MKTYIIAFLVILFSITGINAQPPQQFSYQCILRDSDGNLIKNHSLSVEINILRGNETGTEVFNETHSTTTSAEGQINLSIGSINDLSTMVWESDKYFIEVSVDGNILKTEQIYSVPFVFYSLETSVADSLNYSKLSNLPEFSTWDTIQSDDFDGQFNSLLMWSKKDNGLYYNQGKVGIQLDDNNLNGAALKVGGAILYNGSPTDTTRGLLYYDPAGNGSFRYFDNNGNIQVIGNGTITFNEGDSIDGDIVILSDVIWNNRLALGTNAYPGYDFGENVMVFVDDTIRIYFWDTSTTTAFPPNDWAMKFNDLGPNGENYFAITDSSYNKTPFKIMANAINHTLFIGNQTGIKTDTPTEQLEVNGVVKATTFIGDGSGLSGISGATGFIENTGSTTIAADTDNDNTGQIEFQIKNETKLSVSNAGEVAIGNLPASELFDASSADTSKFENFEIEESLEFNSLSISISIENDEQTGPATIEYNVENKNVIIFNPTLGNITINGFNSGVTGQRVTIINKSATNTVTLNHISGTQMLLKPNFGTLILNQYASATYIFNGSYWICEDSLL